MSFQSEIRDSQVAQLLEKVQNRSYQKYLYRVNVEKARAFSNKSITFDFPVTALIGPNGGGKTTLLGAAACAYIGIKPSRFFAKSGRFDASMQNWKFEYEIIDRVLKPNDTLRRSAKFTNYKWSRDRLSREVAVFGVYRTVPATERPELQSCISTRFDREDDKISAIPTAACEAVASILDKNVSKFSFVKVDDSGAVTLIAAKTDQGAAYSEFHFGAGESSIIRMIVSLETLPENSLVLIEEIENGLHPVATIRLVEYLIELAYRRKIQVIFTTHSNEALKPLPDKAIWAAVNGDLYQGKLEIGSLRAINGQVDSRLIVFTEDAFAKAWVEEILRTVPGIAMDAIGVYPMAGDGMAVKVHLAHNLNPTIAQPSVCVIDGDSKQKNSSEQMIFRLPGESPEGYIFAKVLECLDDSSGELAVALLRPYEEEGRVAEVIRSVANTNRDSHVLFSQIGKRLGFIPEARVREAFINVWARHFPNEVSTFLQPFQDKLPMDTQLVSVEELNG
jgi:AAA15 family ATPase/GTPase